VKRGFAPELDGTSRLRPTQGEGGRSLQSGCGANGTAPAHLRMNCCCRPLSGVRFRSVEAGSVAHGVSVAPYHPWRLRPHDPNGSPVQQWQVFHGFGRNQRRRGALLSGQSGRDM